MYRCPGPHSAGAGAERRRSCERYGSELRQESIIINIKLYTRYTISVGQRSHQYVLVIYSIIAQRPTTASLSACRWASRSRVIIKYVELHPDGLLYYYQNDIGLMRRTCII